MVASDGESASLSSRPGGVFGWLRRLVAGAEIAALEARAAKLALDAEAAVAESSAKTRELAELSGRLDACEQQLEESRRAAASKELECRDTAQRLAAARAAADDLEKRSLAYEDKAGEATTNSKNVARKVAELEAMLRDAAGARDTERGRADESARRLTEATAKLARAQASLEAAEQRLVEHKGKASATEARASETHDKVARLERRAREAVEALDAANDAVTILEMRIAELEGTLDVATRDREVDRAASDGRIADLEAQLVEALAQPREQTELESALVERDALVEELERALVQQRLVLEQRGPHKASVPGQELDRASAAVRGDSSS